MPAWALKVASVFTTLLVLAGGTDYAAAHLKNARAPLQPPVADKVATSPAPTIGPIGTLPPLVPLRGRPRPSSGPLTPLTSLQPNVRTANLPPITFTHTS